MTEDPKAEILRAAVEIGGGTALASAPAWFRILAEINIVLATISLTLGILIGLHGVYRIARSYMRHR